MFKKSEIILLTPQSSINKFLSYYYRDSFHHACSTPKLHMLEDHVPILHRWIGFLWEQRAGSIHARFNSISERNYSKMPSNMKQHLSPSVTPPVKLQHRRAGLTTPVYVMYFIHAHCSFKMLPQNIIFASNASLACIISYKCYSYINPKFKTFSASVFTSWLSSFQELFSSQFLMIWFKHVINMLSGIKCA